MSKVQAAARLSTLPVISIWEEMTPLAIQNKAINLGQGFPNFTPPQFLLDELNGILAESAANPLYHQYCPVRGNAELVTQLRKLYSKRFGREIAPNEVVVTNGVTQGLNVVTQAFLNPGDEIVLIEPFYESYYQDLVTCGAVAKYVSLQPSTESSDAWSLSEEALVAAVTPKTKFIIVNTPQNIPGKVWSKEELEIVAKVAKEHDIVVIADEVYMYLTYGKPHVSIATLPDMWERTITLCSAGKTFSATGWKIGWAVACPRLSVPLAQTICGQTFCTATPLQIAIARAMDKADEIDYYNRLRQEYEARVENLYNILNESGLTPVKPSGGFFVMANISRVDPKHYYDPNDTVYAKDWQFCRWITKTIGVCAIPTTAFCSTESKHIYENYVRFAACKPDSDLGVAAERLKKIKDYFQ